MARIRSQHTGPELLVRRILHRAGFRFRLHRSDLPGKPDIVLPRWRAVIDVRGCYWHAHNCPLFQRPKQNAEFWDSKLGANVERDTRNDELLRELGWRHLIVWECSLRGKSRLTEEDLETAMTVWLHSDAFHGEIAGPG